jgi:signal transduction histidine kinase
MLDINTVAGAPPRDLLDEALRELHGQVSLCASSGVAPPNLERSVRFAEMARDLDAVEDLIKELRDIAHAALVASVAIHAPEAEIPPRGLLDEALRELNAQIVIYASSSARPPQLGPSLTLVRVAQIGDADPQHLTRKLRDLAHAAIASIVRVRAAVDHVPSP